MKPAQIFHQYIWLINTLRAYKGLTFEELNRKWQEDQVADGNPLQRSSFNRHRDAILDMFGIIIDCNKTTYKYFISNREVLSDDSIERWLFSTLTVHGVLADSTAVKERLVLEDAPAGEQYLDIIIRAIGGEYLFYYKSQQVLDYYIAEGCVWVQFNLTLTLFKELAIDGGGGESQLFFLLSSEDQGFVITEDGKLIPLDLD